MKSPIRFALLLITPLLLVSLKCGSKNSDAANSDASNASVTTILTEQQFNALFPIRNKFYTYAAFIKAVKELGAIKIRVARRATSVYQLTRIDKSTGKSTIVRQDEDWNEDWAKKKPDSVYFIDYGLFCAEKDAQTNTGRSY